MTLINSLRKKRFWIGLILALAVVAAGLGVVNYAGVHPQAATTTGSITVKSTPYQGCQIMLFDSANQDISAGKVTDYSYSGLKLGTYQVGLKGIPGPAISGVNVRYSNGEDDNMKTLPKLVMLTTNITSATVTFTLTQNCVSSTSGGIKVSGKDTKTNKFIGGVKVEISPPNQTKYYDKGTTTFSDPWLLISPLSAGTYKVRGSKTCYQTKENSVIVSNGQISESILMMTLIPGCVPPTGTLQINVRGDPWAGIQGDRKTAIFIDGGKPDVQNRFNVSKTVQLEEGSHVVKVEISISTTAKIIDQAGDIVNGIPYIGGKVKEAIRLLGRLGRTAKPLTHKKPPQTKTETIVAGQEKTVIFQF